MKHKFKFHPLPSILPSFFLSVRTSSLDSQGFGCLISLRLEKLCFFRFNWAVEANCIIVIQHQMGNKDEADNKIDVADLQNGPLTEANRQCRDLLCCLLFIGCCGVMIYLAVYGYSNGNLSKIYQGIDQNGKVCGSTTDTSSGGVSYANYPYLYFINPSNSSGFLAQRVCVDSCPTWSGTAINQVNCPTQSECTYTVTYSSSGSLSTGSVSGSNNKIGYDSTLLISRVCIPSSAYFSSSTSIFYSASSSFSSSLFQSNLNDFISDIQNNWRWLLAAAGAAFIIAFIFMFLLRCLAGCIVWLSLFGTIIFLIIMGCIFLYNAGYFSAAASVATYLGVPSISTGYNEPIGWTLIGVGCAFFILVLCCCSRIRLAVAICKSAGQFIASVCLIVFVPVFQACLTISLWGGCLVAMVYLVSSSAFTPIGATYFTTLSDYGDPALIRFYIFVFGTLWVNAFLGAMGIFVVASACCMWYYSHAPGSELSLPIWRSYKMIFRYHWGSLAFGSLLLAIVQFIQLLVQFFKKQAQASGQKNKCVQYAIKCIQCCLACVECIVRFINTQAYIQIALRGKNFCYAAKDGFELVWSNPLRYSIVGGIGNVIMFLGKVAIATLTALCFYLFITYVQSVRSGYLQPFLQVIVVAVIGFIIGMLFMSVYTIAMDTLLQCFIVDETNQKAKGKGKPQWAPEDLADLMDTQQKQNAKQ